MTVFFVLLLFAVAIGIDYFKKTRAHQPHTSLLKGTTFTTPGFEFVGAVAQDGGEPYNSFLGEGI
jgi:hypothetical protein